MVDLVEYDEGTIYAALAQLDRSGQTMVAAACAESIWPLFERYAALAPVPDQHVASLRQALDAVWGAASQPDSIEEAGAIAEALIPGDAEPWIFESGYAQNAVAAVAYAARTWLSADPQQAVWAGRQVFEAADLAAQKGLDRDAFTPEVEVAIRNSVFVRWSVSSIHKFLTLATESDQLRLRAAAREVANFAQMKFP